MSKNNKQKQRIAQAKTRNRTKGYKGPARTTPKHTKKKAWYQLKDANGMLLIFSKKVDEAKKAEDAAKKKAEKQERQNKKAGARKGKKAANDEDAIAA